MPPFAILYGVRSVKVVDSHDIAVDITDASAALHQLGYRKSSGIVTSSYQSPHFLEMLVNVEYSGAAPLIVGV